MTKCFENFVSQTLGFITRFCAAELRINYPNGVILILPADTAGQRIIDVFEKNPNTALNYETINQIFGFAAEVA